MEQLQCRFYTRNEMSEIINVNKTNHHFNDKVKTTLINWGYSFEYTRKGVTITRAPRTSVEKLNEILIRKLGFNVSMKCIEFAFFLYSLTYDDNFSSMPWLERKRYLNKQYNIDISERTLRNWVNKLIDLNIIYKDSDVKTYWKTDIEKNRMRVEKNDAERLAYWELFHKMQSAQERDIMKKLWQKFGCCYYSCATLDINAFPEIDVIEEIYDLIREVVNGGKTEEIYKLKIERI